MKPSRFIGLISAIALAAMLYLVPAVGLAQNSSSNWKAPDSADQLHNPLELSERITKAGNQIFQQLCAVCHGKAGRGDGITAAALKPKPADLSAPAVQEQTDGALFWKIKEGQPPMPGFKNQLSDKQLWAVVTYLRSISKEHSN